MAAFEFFAAAPEEAVDASAAKDEVRSGELPKDAVFVVLRLAADLADLVERVRVHEQCNALAHGH